MDAVEAAPGDWGAMMLAALCHGRPAALSVALQMGPWDDGDPPSSKDLLGAVGQSGSVECLALLAESGQLLPGSEGAGPGGPWAECLTQAASHGRIPLLRLLRQWLGGIPVRVGPGGGTVAHTAARAGQRDVLQWLVSEGASGDQLTSADDAGMTVLHAACAGPRAEEALGVLLLHKAVRALVNAQDSRRAWTALHVAARSGSTGAVRSLLAVDATHAALKDHKGLTPLLCAALEGHEARG